MIDTISHKKSLWFSVLRLAALGKAAIVGISLSLALMGAFDVAFAVTAEQWWDSIRPDWIVNVVAATGAVGGIIARIVA
ncbi:hypothetical protein KUV51_20170 [Tateyamaria omphalii]|uniref:hypothetical protein n=1 Tax=Tateyamaria omphalii TaxID=299262 RepID=UPI001C99C8AD|nr:hypothetical protein [Tateyamaria omphalii]MBY5935334.1 hypothetical protein [Tateyamaria omphalii]